MLIKISLCYMLFNSQPRTKSEVVKSVYIYKELLTIMNHFRPCCEQNFPLLIYCVPYLLLHHTAPSLSGLIQLPLFRSQSGLAGLSVDGLCLLHMHNSAGNRGPRQPHPTHLGAGCWQWVGLPPFSSRGPPSPSGLSGAKWLGFLYMAAEF